MPPLIFIALILITLVPHVKSGLPNWAYDRHVRRVWLFMILTVDGCLWMWQGKPTGAVSDIIIGMIWAMLWWMEDKDPVSPK